MHACRSTLEDPTIGGVAGLFCATTATSAADTTPDAFTFAAQSGVATGATVTSNAITVNGINAASPISVSGGTFNVNGGSYTTASGSVNNGDTVTARVVAASTAGAQACMTVTIGGVAGQFCVTTQSSTGTGGGTSATGTTGFTLTSSSTQTLAPFTLGLAFRKGDIPGTPVLNIPDQQVVVMRRWNDGSVKHAIASGHVSLSAGTSRTITASNGSPNAATPLTAANVQSANPQASIGFGSLGTVNLSSLLAAPFRTFVSGPEMVEAHYRAAVGSDATLVAWFHVRLYKNGRVWVRAIADNGYLDIATADKSYVPTVTIGGAQVWNNGGAALTHYAHTRWAQEGWIGGDPTITPQLDTAYLKSTRLVPNYLAASADQTTLSGLYQTYAPNQNGGWTANMGDTGYQAQIGLLPVWDALYVTSGGDARAYRSVIANAKALNSYPIQWNDSVTKVAPRPSDRPNWSVYGANGGGSNGWGAGSLNWELAHHGSGGYFAYLITGDYYFLETMENQMATVYLVVGPTDWSTNPSSTNYGTSRWLNGQTRAYAWSMRTLSQLAAIYPSGDPVGTDFATLLANNASHLKAVKDTIVPAGIGYIYEYDPNLYGPGLVAAWQQHFFMQAVGMGSDLEPLANMSVYNEVRDYLYRGAVGILGDSTGYCFTQAAAYNIKMNDGVNTTPNGWYKTWSQVYAATFASPPACGNTLGGTSGGDPGSASTGYWGNLIPAIAYAVDHGASGASAAYARLTGATNWNTVLASGFDRVPIWGVAPRGGGTPPTTSDTTPDAFSFAAQTGVALGSFVTSNAIVVSGINAAAPISVSGGSYSVNGGAPTTVSGTVNNGDSVTVRLAAAATGGTQTCASLTIGGVSAPFCATTAAAPTADTTPDAFGFTAQTGVSLNVQLTSNTITPTGYDTAAPISITGGSYSIDGGAFVTTAGTINPGQTVAVRQTSSSAFSTTTTATLGIGGVSGSFAATTLAMDTTPDAFSFTPQSAVATSTAVTSNAVTITGINAATPIGVAGGTYSINGSAYLTTASTVTSGSTVTVKLMSSSTASTQTCAALTVGGLSAQFCATTAATVVDTVPNPFAFAAQTGLATSTIATSNPVTPTGYTAATTISVSGGSYSINGGPFVTTAGTITPGQTVALRQTSSATAGATTTATVTIGGVAGSFAVTTAATDTTPDPFSFTTVTGVALNTTVQSNTVTITGINAAAPVSVTGGSYSVNGAAFTSSPTTLTNGSTLRAQLTSGSTKSVQTCATVSVGGVAAQFCATTSSQGSVFRVSRGGRGKGNVLSTSGSIDCGSTCATTMTNGSKLQLTATSTGTSQFTGWLGACTGTGSCVVNVNGDGFVSATFSAAPVGTKAFDIDGDGQVDAMTDGVLILRYLFGLPGSSVISGAVSPNATRKTAADILGYLGDIAPMLDVDGDGDASPLTDGVIILRYLFGLRGDNLMPSAVSGDAIRTTPDELEAQLRALTLVP